ncbi:hypothetical protein [Streptomyces sp. KL118A]|uniref:hypothetical protein n=1 Tax=Streptomyces sp. KL118A TaxID=3045153 RepID=UPI00278C057D|nr:hypothetical protein [Streptomyces sp. KL118A]
MTTTPRTWVEGGVVSAVLLDAEVRDQFNSFFGAWTSWTPTWVAEGGAAPTPGNGTLAGRYSTSLHYSARGIHDTGNGGVVKTLVSDRADVSGVWDSTLPFVYASGECAFPSAPRSRTTSTVCTRSCSPMAPASPPGHGTIARG